MEICELIVRSPTKSCMLGPIQTSLVINVSLSTGTLPKQFKQAVVIPLLKKPGLDTNTLKHFRPMSNLPFVSKALEKLVLRQLQKHLTNNSLLEMRQSAYRKDYSTETAMLGVLGCLLVKAHGRLVSLIAC